MTISETRVKASPNQARYVKAELSGIGSYMIPVGHLVEGAFDEAAFRSAADAMVLRHEALRSRFDFDGSTVYALVSPEPIYQFHMRKMSDDSL